MNHEKYFHFIVGGRRYGEPIYDEIYKYQDGVWSLADKMKTKRVVHSVSVVSKHDILSNCL